MAWGKCSMLTKVGTFAAQRFLASQESREEEVAGGGTSVDAWTALLSTTTTKTTALKP